MAKIHGVKKSRYCGCRGCGCGRCNPIGEPQTQTNRTEPIPVASLPDYERLLNLGEVTDYQDYLDRYVKGAPGEDGEDGGVYIPNPETETYWLDGVDTGIPIGSIPSPESATDLFE